MALATGRDAMRKLCDALGIDWRTRPIQRIVIDMAIDSVAKVYIQEVATIACVDAAAAVLGTTEVDVIPTACIVLDERTGEVTAKE